MKRFALWLIALFVSLTLGEVSYSTETPGNEGGNGGETIRPETGSAWFLSPVNESSRKFVSICFQRQPDFQASEQLIRNALSIAINSWEVYLASMEISTLIEGQSWAPTISPGPSAVMNTYEVNQDLIHSRCKGNEDLRFIFGTSAAHEIRQAARTLHKPIAFSFRKSYDRQKGWGRGFVWVAPEGSLDRSHQFPTWNEETLSAILTHELGHVLGCEHVSGTIMRKDIRSYLFTQTLNPISLNHLFRINQERELILKNSLTFLRPLLSRQSRQNAIKGVYDSIFLKAMGRENPNDDLVFYGRLPNETDIDKEIRTLLFGAQEVSSEAPLFARFERREFDDHYEFSLSLTNRILSKSYRIETQKMPVTTETQAKVFRISKGDTAPSSFDGGSSQIYTGTLSVGNGQKFEVLILRNSLNPLAGISAWIKIRNVNYILFTPDSIHELWTNVLEPSRPFPR